MLIGLKGAALGEGDRVALTLTFDDGSHKRGKRAGALRAGRPY